MKTISVSISDLEYNQFGIKNDKSSFTEFFDLINKALSKQAFAKSVQLAEMYQLSKMTMDEISYEVKAVRNAKGNHWYQHIGFSIDSTELSEFMNDKNDNKLLELASESKADFIITDTNDFPMPNFKETRVVSPKDYWENFRILWIWNNIDISFYRFLPPRIWKEYSPCQKDYLCRMCLKIKSRPKRESS